MGGWKNYELNSPRLNNPQTNFPWHYLIFPSKSNNMNFDLGKLRNFPRGDRPLLTQIGLSLQPLTRKTWDSKQWLRGFHSNFILHS